MILGMFATTNAQPAGTPHQRSSQEGIAKGLARLLRTTEAAIYVGFPPQWAPWSRISPFIRNESGSSTTLSPMITP